MATHAGKDGVSDQLRPGRDNHLGYPDFVGDQLIARVRGGSSGGQHLLDHQPAHRLGVALDDEHVVSR